MTIKLGRRALIAAASAALLAGPVTAGGHQVVDSIHFLIPGGAGGGWDGTARGTGEALTNAGLVGSASFENMSGGGGGKAIGYLIENADSNHGTLMVNSTPIVIRSLTGVFPHNFRDLTLVAGTIGDYAAMVVGKDSPLNNMNDLLAAYKANPRDTAIGGGSVPGGMDHLVAAMVMQAAGEDPTAVKYIPYDAGGDAMAALLSGEINALSTGFSEAVALAEAGEVKICGFKRACGHLDVATAPFVRTIACTDDCANLRNPRQCSRRRDLWAFSCIGWSWQYRNPGGVGDFTSGG
ncbi:MAG: tripartite tricarboxylate transporter substrate-binding protein [Pikeienuella sp.]